MSIIFNASNQTFHLQAFETSYVIKIIRSKYLSHVYWGKKIRNYQESNELRFVDRAFSANPEAADRTFSLDTLPQENMAFSLKIKKKPKEEIDQRVKEAARILEIEHLLDRKPKSLSGG